MVAWSTRWNMPVLSEIEVSQDSLPKEVVAAMTKEDVDAVLAMSGNHQSVTLRHRHKLDYFPTMAEILDCPDPVEVESTAGRADKVHKKKMLEQASRNPMRAEKIRLLKKSAPAWREMFLELKARELVVDEHYKRRYENEIRALQEQLKAMRKYIGSYDSRRRYPTPQEFEQAVVEYFDECDMNEQAYTVPGLLLCLHMNKRQWRDILNQGPMAYTIVAEMALLKIEGQRNRQMLASKAQVSGYIADLNHHFEWGRKGRLNEPTRMTNNLVTMGVSSEPKSIEEWTDWYKQSIGRNQSDEFQAVGK